MSTDIGVWIGAIGSLCMLSLLYGDNPFFKVAEHTFVGLGAGYHALLGFTNIQRMAWSPLVRGQGIVFAVPLLLGLLVYARYIPKQKNLVRIPTSMVIAVGAALGIRGAIHGEFTQQIAATMALKLNSLNNLIIVAGFLSVLAYFYFTKVSHPSLAGAQSLISKVGRGVMMISFGALFANSMTTFAVRLIGVFQFLFGQWIHLIT